MGFALVVKAAAAAAAAAAEAATVPLPPLVAPRQHHFQLHLHLLPSNNSTVATPTAATSSTATTTTTTSRWQRWRQSPTQPSAQALPPLLQRPQKLSTTNGQQPHPPISTAPAKNQPAPDTSSISSDAEDAGGGVVPETCTATDVLHLMDSLQLPIEADLYLSLVRECTHSGDASQGAQVHAHIQRSRPRLLRRAAGLPLANRLLLMYAACGQPDSARQMFDRMPFRDAMSWAAMLAALAHNGGHREALQLFTQMRESAVEPGDRYSDALVLVTTLRSCVRAREPGVARQVHGLALKVLGESGAIGCGGIGSSLLQCYSMLGSHQSARRVFESMRVRSRGAAAWTCMITGCCREGRFQEALYVFREMGRAGHRRNCHVVSSILAACARIGDGGWGGRQVHAGAVKLGVDEDRFVGSSLVDMYAKHGLLQDARRAFEMIAGSRDCVCWNAMLAGYARGGCCSEAIRLLYEMRAAGIRPQELMVSEVRMACSSRFLQRPENRTN